MRRGRAFTAWITVTAVAAALLVGGGIWVSNYLKDAFAPGLSVGCTAAVGTASFRLTTEQAQNAALISAISVQRGMPARAASIALATALQESKLRNIDYGDMDSVGLFQQRPSQDWGTAQQIMDPVYSTNAFYDALDKVDGYVDMPLNDAAQIVQRSAFPHAYAQHEDLSRAFASALTGQTPATFSCTLPAATTAGSPQDLETSIHAELGQIPVTSGGSAANVQLAVTDSVGWAAAQWAVANASALGITAVSYDGQEWDRAANDSGTNVGWKPAKDPSPAGQVTVLLATAPAAP